MTAHMLEVVRYRLQGHRQAACRGCPDSLHVRIARLARLEAYLTQRLARG